MEMYVAIIRSSQPGDEANQTAKYSPDMYPASRSMSAKIKLIPWTMKLNKINVK